MPLVLAQLSFLVRSIGPLSNLLTILVVLFKVTVGKQIPGDDERQA